MKKSWIFWAGLQAGITTLSIIFQKCVFTNSKLFEYALLGALIIGVIQVIGGLIITNIKGVNILTTKKYFIGSCLFGLGATLATIISFAIYQLEGDLGIYACMLSLSIIPGALIDYMAFGKRLNKLQCYGVLVAGLAGWSILNWPNFSAIKGLPLWFWLACTNMMVVTLNQITTKWIKDVNPFVKNVWGGATTTFLASALLIGYGWYTGINVKWISPEAIRIEIGSIVVGLFVIGLWTANVMTYKKGAYVAIKKLVVNGGSLIAINILGSIIFPKEHMTIGKIIGICLYLFAFMLIDENTWKITKKILRNEV